MFDFDHGTRGCLVFRRVLVDIVCAVHPWGHDAGVCLGTESAGRWILLELFRGPSRSLSGPVSQLAVLVEGQELLLLLSRDQRILRPEDGHGRLDRHDRRLDSVFSVVGPAATVHHGGLEAGVDVQRVPLGVRRARRAFRGLAGVLARMASAWTVRRLHGERRVGMARLMEQAVAALPLHYGLRLHYAVRMRRRPQLLSTLVVTLLHHGVGLEFPLRLRGIQPVLKEQMPRAQLVWRVAGFLVV